MSGMRVMCNRIGPGKRGGVKNGNVRRWRKNVWEQGKEWALDWGESWEPKLLGTGRVLHTSGHFRNQEGLEQKRLCWIPGKIDALEELESRIQ